MKNISLKVFSVLAALLLARFVNSEGNSSVIGFFVPVEIRNLPKDKILIWPLTPQAQVSVKGPSFLVSNVAASPPTFKVKVPSEVQNQFVATLKKTDLALPPNVHVVNIEPSEIKFTFDTVIERELPVEITNLGALKGNLKLDDVTLTPARVRVRGPESRIKDLINVQTEPIDLREVSESLSREMALRSPAALVEFSPSRIRVNMKVSSVRQQKRFTGLPVEIRSLGGEKYALTPAHINVEVSGPVERISALKPEEVIPFVRVPSNAIVPMDLEVATELPKDFTIVQIDPSRVQVVKSAASSETKKLTLKPKAPIRQAK